MLASFTKREEAQWEKTPQGGCAKRWPGRDGSAAAASQGRPRINRDAQEARQRQGRIRLQVSEGGWPPVNPLILGFSLQNQKTTDFCCFRSLRLWYFVTAALADQHMCVCVPDCKVKCLSYYGPSPKMFETIFLDCVSFSQWSHLTCFVSLSCAQCLPYKRLIHVWDE